MLKAESLPVKAYKTDHIYDPNDLLHPACREGIPSVFLLQTEEFAGLFGIPQH